MCSPNQERHLHPQHTLAVGAVASPDHTDLTEQDFRMLGNLPARNAACTTTPTQPLCSSTYILPDPFVVQLPFLHCAAAPAE